MLALSGQRASGLTDGSGEVGIYNHNPRMGSLICPPCVLSISLSTCLVHVGTCLRLETTYSSSW